MAASVARDDKGRFVSVAWTGTAEMQARVRAIASKFPSQVAAALYVETEIEATECKRRCPVLTGALRSSIFVIAPAFQNGKIYTMIVCGGPSAPYAVYVHENLTAYHKVGQAKFIESTLLESAPYIADRVAHRIEMEP